MLGSGSLPISTASRLTDLYPRHFIHAFSHRRNYKLDVGIRSWVACIILQVSAHRMRCSCRCKCPPLSVCLRARRESNRTSPLRGRAGGCAEAPQAGLPPRGRPSLTQDRTRLPIATTAHPISQISKLSSTLLQCAGTSVSPSLSLPPARIQFAAIAKQLSPTRK
jgi:hypothetical protein